MFRLLTLLTLLPAVAAPQTPAADKQLEVYIERALKQNPRVAEGLARYRAALDRVPQLKALPDPMLQIQPFVRSPETRIGPQRFAVSLSQRLPWFGKLDERGKVAVEQADHQFRQLEAVKADIVRDVKLAYHDLAFVDQAISITEQDTKVLAQFERLATARYSQGVGLQHGVVKLHTEITRQRARIEQLRSQRVDAEARLNALMDQPPSTPLARTTPGARPVILLDPEALAAAARRDNPELLAANEAIEREQQRIRAARKEYRPDFTVGVGYINAGNRSDPAGRSAPPPDNGKDVWSVSLGVNIPLRKAPRDAAVMEATELMIASREARHAERNSIEAAIRALTFRLQTTTDQIELFEGTLLPQARQALRASETAYSTGAVSVLDLLDSERMLLDVRLGLARLHADYMKTVAELERKVGGPLS